MEKILTLRGTLLCALLFLFGFIQAQETASITGTVLSDSDADRLEGASVALQNTSRGTITDGGGQFVLENLTPGDYTVVVSSIGFESITRPITLRANENRRLTFELRASQTLLSEITIRGAALDPRNRTITVNEVDREQIQTLNLDLPIRIIEQVPGVDLLSYNQGGVADQFSIRGFGGGGHEGQAGAQIDGYRSTKPRGTRTATPI